MSLYLKKKKTNFDLKTNTDVELVRQIKDPIENYFKIIAIGGKNIS